MQDAVYMWVEKYRPKTLKDCLVSNENIFNAFDAFIKEKEIPHLLLSGVSGTGKTTLAQILISEIAEPNDVLKINSSDENSVDVFRSKITNFISTIPDGKFKIVHLSEAEYLSLNAQALMRDMMETYHTNARFILTCNTENKIMPAIHSRCQSFKFKSFNKKDICRLVVKILKEEKVDYNNDDVVDIINALYPDIRKITNALQQNSKTGKLILERNSLDSGIDYKFELLELLKTDKWVEIRDILTKNVSDNEWEEVYTFFYQNLNLSKKFSEKNNWEKGILILSEHYKWHSLVAVPEINAVAMCIRLDRDVR